MFSQAAKQGGQSLGVECEESSGSGTSLQQKGPEGKDLLCLVDIAEGGSVWQGLDFICPVASPVDCKI